MQLRRRIALPPQALLLCRIFGFCIFAVAFLLPACKDTSPGFSSIEVYPGWRCAWITLGALGDKETYQSWDSLAAVSGLINPLIVAYLGFTFVPRLVLLRRILGISTVVCMVATWVFFWMAHLIPLIGHFLWIAGALLILLPEVTNPRTTPSST